MAERPPYERQTPLREPGAQRPADQAHIDDPLQTPWRGDWGHELSTAPEPQAPVHQESLFNPRVLIGWAALTLVLYFGVMFVRRGINQSVRQSVHVSGVRRNGTTVSSHGGHVVIMLPNGKRITIDGSGAQVDLPEPAAPNPEQAPAAPTAPAPKVPTTAPGRH